MKYTDEQMKNINMDINLLISFFTDSKTPRYLCPMIKNYSLKEYSKEYLFEVIDNYLLEINSFRIFPLLIGYNIKRIEFLQALKFKL